MTDRRLLPTRTPICGLACLLFVALANLSAPVQAALSYTVGGNWPNAAHRAAAESAAQLVVNRYNAYGNFGNANAFIYYNAGIPTAQASYLGSIGFGGTYPNERVMAHEMAHYLGLPSGNWGAVMSGGSWDGAYGLAKVKQLDGEQATINGDGAHFWPYGLNYDSEGSELNKQRQVELVYAMRADLGIGPTAPPSSQRTVNLTADNPAGESGFNFKNQWSDGYTPHAGAVYYTDDFLLRTPASANSFKFYGGPLVVDNADGASGGLQFNGQGSSALVTIDNLRLEGGWVQHASTAGSRFQLGGHINVVSNSVIRAKQGNIDVLANVIGAGDLTIETTDMPDQNDRYVRFRAANNTFVGDIVNHSRFELAAGSNFRFAIGPGGSSNAITGSTARATVLNGAFEFDLSAATFNSGDSWALVTAANTVYGNRFEVSGFTNYAGVWNNGAYSFDQANGLLTLVPSWNVNGGGAWSNAGNWVGGVPTSNGAAMLGSALGSANAPATIVVDIPVSLGNLTFDNTDRYVLSGTNPITLTGGALVTVKSGNHRIEVPVAGDSGLSLGGVGTLELTASNSYSGDTQVNSGALRLSGSGSIVGTTNIQIHRGAKLDITGLAGGLELVSGQTLHNDGGMVEGDVVAEGGATVAANNLFAGNLTVRSGAILRVGGAGLPSAAVAYGLDRIDDFQGYSSGKLNTGVTGGAWTGVASGTDNAQVASDAGNKSLEYYGASNAWRGALTSLRDSFSPDDHSLADGEQATYFFRVQRRGSQSIDGIFGLTDLESIGVDAPWQELAVTMSLFQGTGVGDTASLRAYDGNGGGDVVVKSNVSANEWINIWLVVDNQNKIYQVATSHGDDDGTLFPHTFEFGRQASLGVALDTFAGAEFRAVPGTRNSSAVRIDDLYVAAGSDLTNPLGIVSEALAIEGNLTLDANDSTLQLDLAKPGIHDRLVATGTTRLAGVLEINLVAGFTLSEGDAFDLFDFTTTIGSFDLFDLPTLGSDLRWDLSQLALSGLIAVVAGLDGDFNADGAVDAADYTWWRDHLGAVEDAALLAGNGSEDGIVNDADYQLWKANFGQSVGGTESSAATVPEPQAFALMIIGIFGVAHLCRR